jgi:hypothetical protein
MHVSPNVWVDAPAKRPVKPKAAALTMPDLVEFAKEIVHELWPDLRAYVEREIARALAPVAARVSVLEFETSRQSPQDAPVQLAVDFEQIRADIEELKSRPILKDADVWRPGVAYTPGSLVSFDGSAWFCRKAHVSEGTRPDHENFRLLVKHGAPGRAGRDGVMLREGASR